MFLPAWVACTQGVAFYLISCSNAFFKECNVLCSSKCAVNDI
jgi:hypothetical protein